MKKLAFLSFLFVLFTTNSFSQVSDSERVALIAIYNSTNGDNWRYGHSSIANGTEWLGIKGTECNWYGVTCTSDSVTSLSLVDNLLTGKIPQEISNLENLTQLLLSRNAIGGEIPGEIGSLKNLNNLSLFINELTGTIPPELGALESLTDLWLNNNSLSGSIPPVLGNLASLENLILSSNSIEGSLPSELGNLANLKQVSFDSNNLTGSIPPELGNLKKLVSLSLGFNSLNGSIPKELGGLGELERLGIFGNASLTGPIPAELGNLESLKFLFLYDQNLTGSIPSQLSQLKNLETLSIYGNALTGEIPKALGSLTNIKLFWMANNSLTGNIPSELGDLSNVQQISLYNNMLNGEIPTELGNLENLWNLNLSFNSLTGSIPKQLGGLSKLRTLNVSGNSLDESIFYPTALTNPNLKLYGATKSSVVSEVADEKNDESDKSATGNAPEEQLVSDDSIQITLLTADGLSKLKGSAVAALSKLQIEGLSTESVSGLTSNQIANISLEAIKGFKKDQVANLSKAAVGGFTTDQFNQLSPAGLGGLTKDNLGGLVPKVIATITSETLSNLSAEVLKAMPPEEFSKFVTELDSSKITNNNVKQLLPSDWVLEATGELKAPAGSKLSFKSLDPVTNINKTSLPPLPDLSKSFSLGGKGNEGILEGLDKAIDSNNIGYKFEQRSDGILNLRAVDAAREQVPVAAFLPDKDQIKQAPKNFVPGISIDSRGAYVLITDKGYSIPLLPALTNPDDVKNLLPPSSAITIASGGQTIISDLGDGRVNPIAGIPSPLTSTSTRSAGVYSIGSGVDEKIEIVQSDGSLQVLSPAFKDQDGLSIALYAIPEVAGVEINTDGTVDLIYNGSPLILKPHFDVQTKLDGGKYPEGITQDNGKFYFSNKKGERQRFN